MGDWAVVIPSNRPERLARWRTAWRDLLDSHDVTVYVVEDASPWAGIPWWVPRHTDQIRSWGLYEAWRDGHRWVASMDDDIEPIAGVDPFWEYELAFRSGAPVSPYLSVGALTDTCLEMRGFPQEGRGRPVAVQYGGWVGVPDLDGVTQLAHPVTGAEFAPLVVPVPRFAALTCCAMNFAVARDQVPWCWQMPLERGRHNRWGDIWSGLVQKRLCDEHMLSMLVNGRAAVVHDRASDPSTNAAREASGRPLHEGLWEALLRAPGTFEGATDALGRHVGGHDPEWLDHFLRARDAWQALFR